MNNMLVLGSHLPYYPEGGMRHGEGTCISAGLLNGLKFLEVGLKTVVFVYC